MSRYTIWLLIGLSVLGALLINGCIEEEETSTESKVTAPTPETEDKISIPTTKIPQVDDAWWDQKWSKDGLTLNIDYNEVLSGSSGKDFIDYGRTGERTMSVDSKSGTDIFGKKWNETVKNDYKILGGSTKPTLRTIYRTVTHSTGFARTSTASISYTYTEDGFLMGGSGSEKFSGSLPGGLTYSGSSNVTYGAGGGTLAWEKRVEQASYYKDDKFYAETITVVVPESKYISGRLKPVRETERTTTTYAAGSRRESEIVILYNYDSSGNVRKRGNGTLTGTEIIYGLPVNYTGTITITYPGPGMGGGDYKLNYEEKRSAMVSLPKRLPFEVIFSDDYGLRGGLH